MGAMVSNVPDVPRDDVVELAIKAGIESVSRGEWALLDRSEKTRRIYYEMRRIDAEDAVHSWCSLSSPVRRRCAAASSSPVEPGTD